MRAGRSVRGRERVEASVNWFPRQTLRFSHHLVVASREMVKVLDREFVKVFIRQIIELLNEIDIRMLNCIV